MVETPKGTASSDRAMKQGGSFYRGPALINRLFWLGAGGLLHALVGHPNENLVVLQLVLLLVG